MLKPQNDSELAERISLVIHEAGKLNRLMSEGKLFAVDEALHHIEVTAILGRGRLHQIMNPE